MYNPSNYKPIDIWATHYRRVLFDTLIVMNALKFDKEKMHDFKNGVKFTARTNYAKHIIVFDDTKEMIDFVNEGHHKRWSFARIRICDDMRVRCFLIERKQEKNEFTHYLTVRDGKVVLVTL